MGDVWAFSKRPTGVSSSFDRLLQQARERVKWTFHSGMIILRVREGEGRVRATGGKTGYIKSVRPRHYGERQMLGLGAAFQRKRERPKEEEKTYQLKIGCGASWTFFVI